MARAHGEVSERVGYLGRGKKQNDRQQKGFTSLATFISRYIRYSCSAENIRTVIVAAMKCAFGWHPSGHRLTFIGFGMD